MRYFIAVAEELHFSRAAARLFVAQQALSRQIRELEDELATPLFIRTTRNVELTEAGTVFLAGVRAIVDALDETVARTLSVSRSVAGTLRVGLCIGAALELTDPILTEFRDRYPKVNLELREVSQTEPSGATVGDASDLRLVRLPCEIEDRETEVLFTEPIVAAVSVRHRLADRTEVNISDLLAEPITLSQSNDARYRAFWSLEQFRGGQAAQVVEIRSITEEMQVVANGEAIALTLAAASRYMPYPNVRYIPIADAPRSAAALVWRADARHLLIESFREVAVAVRDREADIVARIESPFRKPSTLP